MFRGRRLRPRQVLHRPHLAIGGGCFVPKVGFLDVGYKSRTGASGNIDLGFPLYLVRLNWCSARFDRVLESFARMYRCSTPQLANVLAEPASKEFVSGNTFRLLFLITLYPSLDTQFTRTECNVDTDCASSCCGSQLQPPACLRENLRTQVCPMGPKMMNCARLVVSRTSRLGQYPLLFGIDNVGHQELCTCRYE